MVKLLKSGLWALEGVHVVEMVAGEEKDFGPVENCKLVDAGWGEWFSKKTKAAEPVALHAPAAEFVSRRGPGRPKGN